jgi:GNAT superfamily N-acetyltransferase
MRDVTIREARQEDAGTIVRLIGELAEFERLRAEVKVTEADLLRDGLRPGVERRFECLLAERGGVAIGFALFFHNYSTFEGRAGIYVEDVFVEEAARGAGVGRALLRRLASLAAARGCPRLELSVLHWNPARAFYERLGFRHLDDWRPHRLAGAALARLAAEDESEPGGR